MFVSTPPLRWRALLATLLVVAMTTALIPPRTAQAAVEDQPQAAADAAAWIVAELAEPEPSFDNFGKTAARTDVVYALAAIGGNEGAARRALIELRDGAADYVGPADTPDVGALAKALLAVQIAGADPTSFIEGRDLEAELRATMDPSGNFAGDVFTQALAMIALGTTNAGVPAAATDALEARQCDAGDFTFLGTCPGLPTGPDVDTTAVAIEALLAGNSASATTAAESLVSTQNPDGSWPNAFGEPNTNSAGIAGQALRAAGETASADLAAEFVMTLQTDDGGFRFVASDTEANGFATLQAVLSLGGPAYFELSNPVFADVTPDHLFATEITWLGLAEVSKGCDPPLNDHYCPDGNVTRGQMAAFLVRALGLTETGDVEFTDDNNSVFEDDIRRLAAAGITRGCNPPDNDHYCPDDGITRGQMAAFLHRALEG